MRDKEPPPSLQDLEARLEAARKGRDEAATGRGAEGETRLAGLGLAFRITTELVVGIAVGVGIGWGLDFWLGTGPWLLILFFFLGAGAGMLNMYRVVAGLGSAVGYLKPDETERSETEDRGPAPPGGGAAK